MVLRADERKAWIFGLTAVLCWSTVATAFKIALAHLDIQQLILIACLSSGSLLLALTLVQGRGTELLQSLNDHWRISLVSALMNPLIYYVVLFEAYNRLPAQVAQPINYTWAIVLSILSVVILGQRLALRDILACIICYAGVLLVAAQGEFSLPGGEALAGLLFAIGSTVIWAGYWILNLKDPRDPVIAVTTNFLLASPIALLLCWLFSDFTLSKAGLLAGLYVGCFEMGIAFLCWSLALRYAENTARVSNLIFISPFLSLILIGAVLGEPLYWTTFAGLLVIIGGLLIQKYAPF
ncbi:MAG: DMT family transporter [Pseudomonadales bacterium]|nr:DMT family transporter [Pseudomonadales bacterium]